MVVWPAAEWAVNLFELKVDHQARAAIPLWPVSKVKSGVYGHHLEYPNRFGLADALNPLKI